MTPPELTIPQTPLDHASATQPVSRPRPSILFLTGSLAGGNIVSMVLRMVAGILLGRLVAPATLGLFNGIALVLGYAPFLQLGILNGLNRELPYYVGKGDRRRVEELAAAAQSWALLVGFSVCAVLLLVAGWQFAAGEMWKSAGWATNAILAVFLFYGTHYLEMTYRTAHDFARLAMVHVIHAAAGLLLLCLVSWFNFYGLCLRAILSGAITVAVLYYWRPVRVWPRWNLGHLKHLLIVGAPIFGVGQLYAWWAVITSTLVLSFAGVEGMGLYAMVVMAGSTLEMIPMAVSQVVYPRMTEQYGRTHRLDDLLRIAIKPMLLTACGIVPIIAVAWWLVGPAVRMVIPAYEAAVPAMQWGLLISFISSFNAIINTFNVVKRQDLYAFAIIAGMVSTFTSLMWLIGDEVYLAAFPQAMLIGRSVFIIICYSLIVYLRNKQREPLSGHA